MNRPLFLPPQILYGGTDALFPVDALAALEKRCFTDPWSRASLEGTLRLPTTRLLLLRDLTGTPVGFAMAFLIPPEGEVGNLAIAPELRRQGGGRRLMAAIRQLCREERVDTLFLEVRASNAGALALYESEGFRRTGIRRHYYRHPAEDAVTMVCHVEG